MLLDRLSVKSMTLIYLTIGNKSDVMEKIKKKSKLKEPIRLRVKELANGNRSLYLDTYYEGKRSYEFLRIYLVPEKSTADREVNTAALRAANAIKASRTIALINGKADIKTPRRPLSMAEWIKHIIDKKTGIRSRSSIQLMRRLMKHLEIFHPGAMLQEADRSFCAGFADYLRSANALNSNKRIGITTQYELLNALSIVLNEAVRAELITHNSTRMLTSSERIKKPESKREHLTPEEVRSLIKVSADHIAAADDVAAFLFCCFCGLRYSDVTALKWENIIEIDGGKEIVITMKKTRRRVTVPLSEQACSLLPREGAPDTNVFTFPSYGVTLRSLEKTVKIAGITKKVTFHVSRHTFATMMLTAGVDLYTISKLIGHTDIRTTQIYSKVVDRKKREAVALLDRLF